MTRAARCGGARTPAVAALAVAALAVAGLGGAPAVRAQEADAVAPGGRQGRVPDSVPARGGTGLPPVGPAAGPGAAGQELDDLTARVASRLRCPVCRSQSVLESSATLAQQMQREIRRRLAAGQSPEEVEAYFVSRYGEWILLKPEPEGFNLLVYLLPAAVLLGGALLVWSRLRAWTGAAGGSRGEEASPAAGEAAPHGPGPAVRSAPDRPSPGEEGLSPEEEERVDALIRERETGGGSG